MKLLTIVIAALLFGMKVLAQTEPANYHTAINKFEQFYNAGQPDSIFNMFSPAMKAALPADKFTATTAQLKIQLGNIDKIEFLKYNAPLAVYKASFEKSAFLLNVVLDSHDMFAGLLLKPQENEPVPSIPLDPSLTESPVLFKTLSGAISGTLTMPKNTSGKIPVVLIIAGSGPTDRDGNNLSAGVTANEYKLLAYALGQNGIASLRYDKRMVGQSASSAKEDDLRFGDYVDDAVGLIGLLNDDERFSEVIVAGHSEGSLVGMLASIDEPVKAYISLAGAGQPADKILTEQLKSKPDYVQDEFKTVLDSLRKGKTTPNVDPAIYFIARPSVQQYLMSWCRYDPTRVIRELKMPILIVQGTTDLQVSVDNAQKLESAKSSAKLVIIRGMSHILKDAPPDADQNMATYKNPTLPLNAELVTTVVDFIKGLK